MDQHALAQKGWALQYEQLSSGQFKGRIHQVQLPEVTLLREDTSIALRQLGRLDDSVYGLPWRFKTQAIFSSMASEYPPTPSCAAKAMKLT
jgi:hypothetical protein